MVLYVANAMMEIGKTLIGRNVDMIKGLNALKTAYNLNPREPAIQKDFLKVLTTCFGGLRHRRILVQSSLSQIK